MLHLKDFLKVDKNIFMKIFFLLLLLCLSLFASSDTERIWEKFKEQFIQQDGRIIDPYNGSITHTESIGYTLYFSYMMNDKKTFQKIFLWSQKNIKKNNFGLPGWKWGENKIKKCWCTLDVTSASDANLWIVYSLYLMYEKTAYKPYKIEADKMLSSIKKYQILSIENNHFLLPWEKNLLQYTGLKLNPSYLLFEIFEYLANYDQDKVWTKLIKSSILLLKQARFSSLELNPNWVIYNKTTKNYLLPKNNKYFGYDAIRIPLNIIRSDLPLKTKKELLQPYKRYIEMMKNTPLGIVELNRGDISLYNLSFGYLAVYSEVAKFFNIDSRMFQKKLKVRIQQDDTNYYAYSLYLFTLLH